jgi:hypothetical protein
MRESASKRHWSNRRSGKFGAQLARLEASGFAAFIHLRNDDGTIIHGEIRTLGASDSTDE